MHASGLANTEAARRLPEPARAKLLKMQATEDGLFAAHNALNDPIAHARDRARLAAARLSELEKLPVFSPRFLRTGGASPQYEPPGAARDKSIADQRERVLSAARDELNAARDELQRLENEASAIRERSSSAASRCIGFLRAVPGNVTLLPYSGKLKPLNGTDPQTTVAQLRQKLADLRAERASLQDAPYPSRLAKEVAKQEILRLASSGRPDCSVTVHELRPPIFATSPVTDVAGFPALLKTGDATALLCWLFRDQMIAALDREIDAISDDEHAFDAAERKRRDGELAAQILECERLEELAIESAASSGTLIARRADASAIAILGLGDDLMRFAT